MDITKIRRIYLWIHLCLAVFAGAIVFLYLSPFGKLFFCPFSRFMHLYCPLCGGTRALFALLRGELVLSLLYNPTALCLMLSVLYYEVFFWIAFWKRSTASLRRLRFFPLYLTAVVCVLHFVIRNLLLVSGIYDAIGELLPFWI